MDLVHYLKVNKYNNRPVEKSVLPEEYFWHMETKQVYKM